MRSIGTLCHELRLVDGVVGAFVLERSRCVASSLPPRYEINRLSRVGSTLLRLQQIAGQSGFSGDLLAFGFQDASLLAWSVGDDALLGLLTTQSGRRDTLERSVAQVVRELAELMPQRQIEQDAPTRPFNDVPR